MKIVENVLKDAKMEKAEIDEVILVGGSTRIPKVQEMLSKLFNGKQLNKSLNPDEAVAYRAAVQAAILSGVQSEKLKNVKIVDVTALSLCTEVVGGHALTVIKRNTPLPVKVSKNFYTVSDNQTSVRINVYEGERAMAKDNHFLDEFTLSGLIPASRRAYPIQETYEINEDGLLKVTAVDVRTGLSSSITITSARMYLSNEEIQKLKENEEIYKREHHESSQTQSARHILERFCFDKLRELKTKNSDDQSENDEIMAKCRETIEWLDANHMAKRSEFENHLKEMEDLCSCFESSLVVL